MKKTFVKLCSFLLMPAMLLALGGCGKTEKPDDNSPTIDENVPEYVSGRLVVSEKDVNTYKKDYMKLYGRTFVLSKMLHLSNAGTGFEVTFYGTELKATVFLSQGYGHYYRAYVDGVEGERVHVTKTMTNTALVSGLEEGVHTLRIVKVTSPQNGDLIFRDLKTDGKFLAPEADGRMKIEFIGDSITVGAGTLTTPAHQTDYDNSDATRGYAYLTAEALNADCSLVATEGMCVKAKLSFVPNMMEMYVSMSSTQTLSYRFTEKYDIVVVALGTNDSFALKNTYGQAEFTADYKELLTLVREKNPDATIVCTYGMMNATSAIVAGIKAAIAEMKDSAISYVQLPTKTNGGGSHPSAEDAKAQSKVLTTYIQGLINK